MSPSRSARVAMAGALVGAGLVVGVVGIFDVAASPEPPTATCTPETGPPGWSVARRWNEVLLDAIRRDLPAPTIHARNLFHTSAAMWDAWAAYDPAATGVFVHEKHTADDVEAARAEAISYAAYRILEHRYMDATGASDSIPEFDDLMESMCYPTYVTTTRGDDPAAVGNRIAATIITFGLSDGSNESNGYQTGYRPVNGPLVVAESGTVMDDPNRWQPLEIENMVSQNGILLTSGVQQFISPNWGHVAGFALPDAGPDGLPIDPGAPPLLGDPASDQAFKDNAVEVIRFSSLADPAQGMMIDISPGSLGGNTLGTNDGSGHEVNPVTGLPYAPVYVNQADFTRAIAEFWADGPNSETPPGHWNTIANAVSDTLAPDLRLGGTGPVLGRLEWDVKLYLALNGAAHDAAVAAWGAKAYFDYTRPISMIRYMGGLGQSSDPDGPSYDPEGLPLMPDLVEVITAESTATGERHEHLAGHEGEIAVLAWRGTPPDPETETSGVGWILAIDWVPYQLPTFVTPSFAAYVSGHGAFSRAAAEVMAAFTGSEYFPGGLGTWTVPAGSFQFEAGPVQDVVLQWATYADASDQAGISRLYGGIHVKADDLAGRIMGAGVGRAAFAEALTHYDGGGAGGA
ncbi:MAG: vanadium-dependent haloperoxidase [Actinobacteria bacterium]|nr:vanadium-dependent haloperoxidase [Actinomycetota bacterium]